MPELATTPRRAPAASSTERRGAEIGSVAMAVPERTVQNGPIAHRLGISEDWITKRTGVRERRIAGPEERLSAFAAEAGAVALERAGVRAADLDLVLVATMAADELSPNAAPLVAAELGAGAAGAFDVGAACTGFLAALALAAGQIEAGRAQDVLVIGADLLSRLTDFDDRSTAGLLADGAGAVVVRAAPAPGRVGPVVLGSDGERADLITATHEERRVRMRGHETFKQAVARMSQATLGALDAAELELADVDLFVYHQANSRIIRAVGEELRLPAARTVDYVDRFGNTSAGTLPMALALAEAEGRLSGGEIVLLAAFGAGLTWGATVIEWGSEDGS
jgi:3-oxoacyl-[acyl-carrier-protein] synthase III